MRMWHKVLGLVALIALGVATADVLTRGSSAWAQGAGDAAASLAVGDVAPDFTLAGTGEGPVALKSFRGKKAVVLVFYPKDFTSVCTNQLCTLRDEHSALTEAGAVVFGINNNSLESHVDFKAEHEFPFELLVDPDMAVATAYGAARADQPFVDRTVVVVGADGTVLFYAKGVPPVADMLAAIAGTEE